jgi:hypothetical protein
MSTGFHDDIKKYTCDNTPVIDEVDPQYFELYFLVNSCKFLSFDGRIYGAPSASKSNSGGGQISLRNGSKLKTRDLGS